MKPVRSLTFLLILTLFACQPRAEKPIATIGKYAVFPSDVAMVAKLNKLHPGTDTSAAVALYQLKQAYLCLHLADSLGVPVTDSLLVFEKNRIDRQTHMPWRIDSIKAACDNPQTYLRLFVLPQLAKRWLYHHYYRLGHLHHQKGDSAKWLIEKCLATAQKISVFEALSGIALEKTAKQYNYPVSTLKVNLLEGIVPVKPLKNAQNDSMPENAPGYTALSLEGKIYESNVNASIDSKAMLTAKQLIEGVLNNIKTGEIYPYPVETDNAFWVLQYIDYFEGNYYIKIIEIPKMDFWQWYANVTPPNF